MRFQSVQQRSSVSNASANADDGAQPVLKIHLGHARYKRLPAWFFSSPRVVDLWPPEARPVWGRAKGTQLNPPPLMGAQSDLFVDNQAWTQAMQQSTRMWVRQFGTTLGQVNYFTQLQASMAHRLPGDVRAALEALVPTPDGALLFNVLPQLALRSLGHTPLPNDASGALPLLQNGTAILVWPLFLVAPSCCDATLVEAVQSALSPAALKRLGEFGASPLGQAFLRLLRELAEDPMVMTADITVRNNLQAGLRDELQAMHHESSMARLRDIGEQLHRDVVHLRHMLADKADLFLRATPELDRALIALQEVSNMAAELCQGPMPQEKGDPAWEVTLLERVQRAVPNMHASIGNLLGVVGLSSATGQTLSLLFHPMGL